MKGFKKGLMRLQLTLPAAVAGRHCLQEVMAQQREYRLLCKGTSVQQKLRLSTVLRCYATGHWCAGTAG